jgi:hypothetical protein
MILQPEPPGAAYPSGERAITDVIDESDAGSPLNPTRCPSCINRMYARCCRRRTGSQLKTQLRARWLINYGNCFDTILRAARAISSGFSDSSTTVM